jgi:hypothetical protein
MIGLLLRVFQERKSEVWQPESVIPIEICLRIRATNFVNVPQFPGTTVWVISPIANATAKIVVSRTNTDTAAKNKDKGFCYFVDSDIETCLKAKLEKNLHFPLNHSKKFAHIWEHWNPYQKLRYPKTPDFIVFSRDFRDFWIVSWLIHAFPHVIRGVVTLSTDQATYSCSPGSVHHPKSLRGFRFVTRMAAFFSPFLGGRWHTPPPSQESIQSVHQIATINSRVDLLGRQFPDYQGLVLPSVSSQTASHPADQHKTHNFLTRLRNWHSIVVRSVWLLSFGMNPGKSHILQELPVWDETNRILCLLTPRWTKRRHFFTSSSS